MLFVQSEKQQWRSIFKNVAVQQANDSFVISTKIISEHIHGWYIQRVANAFISNTVLYFLRLLRIVGLEKIVKNLGSSSLKLLAPK